MLTFVTGKGGVGKTRLSCFLAAKDPKSILAETTLALSEEGKKLGISLPPVYRFTREDLAEEFLVSTLKIKTIARFLSKSSLFKTLLSLAPNLHELLLLQKWIELSRESPLIIDAPSTGHFLSIFDAIKTAQIVFDGGSLRRIANEIDDYLRSEDVVVYVVAIPEHSALEEMRELIEEIRAKYPHFQFKRVLNRKHEASDSAENLAPPLKDFVTRRLALENNRIKGKNFDHIVSEGVKSL